jgi:hypothetical protein
VEYASAERADTLPLFLLYPYKYSVGSSAPSDFTVSKNEGFESRNFAMMH